MADTVQYLDFLANTAVYCPPPRLFFTDLLTRWKDETLCDTEAVCS